MEDTTGLTNGRANGHANGLTHFPLREDASKSKGPAKPKRAPAKVKAAPIVLAQPSIDEGAREKVFALVRKFAQPNHAGTTNVIGVLGEIAADIAVSSHEYYRAVQKASLARRHLMMTGEERMNRDCFAEAATIAVAKTTFSRALMNLRDALTGGGVSDLFDLVKRARDREGAFELCGEWHACAHLAAEADSDDLPSPERVVNLVGRTEMLVERIQAFFKKEGIEPDHFRS
jgi:hypothetical protein